MNAYQKALQKVRLSGPTCFSNILSMALHAASQGDARNQEYTVLLILTDGIINDMDQTTQLVVEGASLPMSIIIVGVGQADFTNMDILDGDDVRLSYRGRKAERDIVQFVPFREFKDKSHTALAEATLEEVPRQISSYFGNRGIKPNPPREASVRNLQRLLSTSREEPLPVAEVIEESN